MKFITGIVKGTLSLMLVGMGLYGGQTWAASILVANFSFESPATTTSTGCPITSWTCVPNDVQQGVFDPTFAQYPNGIIVPDGNQAFYSNAAGGTLSQTTGEAIAASTTYTIDVFVGDRTDTPFPGGSIILTHNGTPIPGATFAITNPGNGFWQNQQNSVTIAAVNPFPGEFLGIRFVNAGGLQLNLDNVRLNSGSPQGAVPEPGTVLLLGTGLVALGILGRRKKAA
jgi:hypothetical protein